MSDPTAGQAIPAPADSSRRRLAGLFAIALAHRALIAAWTTTIASDSAYYLWSAEALARGDVDRALGAYRGIHPLYPALIAIVGAPLGNLVAAGTLVSVLASSLAVIPIYSLIRACWNERVAFWACLLYALHPSLSAESAEIMTTGPYLFLFFTALALFLSALRTMTWARFLLAGVVASLAYLTRPEGILTLLFFGAAAVVFAVRRGGQSAVVTPPGGEPGRHGSPWFRATGGCLIAGAAFVALSAPYLLWLHGSTGRWILSARPIVSTLAGQSLPAGTNGDTAPAPPKTRGDTSSTVPAVDAVPPTQTARPSTLYALVRLFDRIFYWSTVPLLILGIVFCRRQGGRPVCLATLVLMTVTLWAPYLLAHHFLGYPLSYRYLLPGQVFILPWMGAGIAAAADVFSGWEGRASNPARPRWARRGLLAALIASFAVKTARPCRPDEASFIEAGRWVCAQTSETPHRALATRDKLAYYAGCEFVPIPPWDGGPVNDYARKISTASREHKTVWVMMDVKRQDDISPRLHEALIAEGFVPAAQFPPAGAESKKINTVRIYRAP
jgi:hypothetical protein